jgi:hypothetical protein
MFSRPKFFAAVAASMFGALVAFFPGTAHATYLSDCGNIDLSGNESCTFETSGGCTAQCTPVNLQVSCSASLEASCSGGCTGSVEASCTSSCSGSCMTNCSANPGSFNCSGSCEADCSGHCQAQCASDANQSECTSSCQETCGAHCNASCQGTPPSATCDTQCQASCQGSCQAQANFSCDISCQEMGYAMCESNLQGGCTGQCSEPQGALFCNGQYVSVDPSQLQQCESQLQSLLNIQVSASAACSGNTCSGQAAASCGQIAPGAIPMSEGFLAVGLGVGLVGAVRRRVRKGKKA